MALENQDAQGVKTAADAPAAGSEDQDLNNPDGTQDAGGDTAGDQPGDATGAGGPAAGDKQDEPVMPKEDDFPNDPKGYAEALKKYIDENKGKLPKAVRDDLSQSRKRAREAERVAEEERQKRAEAEQKAIEREKGELKPPAPPKVPHYRDYQYEEDYDAAMRQYDQNMEQFNHAMATYNSRKAELESREKASAATAEQDAAERKRAREAKWKKSSKDAETREDLPDFAQVAFSDEMADVTTYNGHLAVAIMESDHSADIAYFLGKNPDEAWRIAAIRDPILVGREIGKLEARVAARAQPGKKTTSAPEPPNTVRGGGSTAVVDVDKMPMAQAGPIIEKRRMERLKKRHGIS